MYVPIPALVAIALVIAFLIFLLRRRAGRDMLDEQRREAGLNAPPPNPRSNLRSVTPVDAHEVLNDPDIRAHIEAGRKIEAIKLVRERSGLGLKEAKELVKRG